MGLAIKKSDVEEVIRQTKELLKEELSDSLERKKSDYFTELKSLSEGYTPREVQECFKKAVNEVNFQIFPSPPEIKILMSFNVYDNRFSVTLENETYLGSVRPKPVLISKKDELTDEFPHFFTCTSEKQ